MLCQSMCGCSIISQEYRKLVGWYWTMMRRQLFTLASSIRCIYTINPGVTCCVITVTLWSLRSSPSSDQFMSIWVRLSPPPASPGTLLWVDPFWWSWWATTDWCSEQKCWCWRWFKLKIYQIKRNLKNSSNWKPKWVILTYQLSKSVLYNNKLFWTMTAQMRYMCVMNLVYLQCSPIAFKAESSPQPCLDSIFRSNSWANVPCGHHSASPQLPQLV